MNTEESKSFISNIDVQTAPVNVGDSSYEESIAEESVNITIGVFFDGTLNNAKNTRTRIAFEKAGEKATSEDTVTYKKLKSIEDEDNLGSYINDLSNVARMEPAYPEITSGKELQSKVYIEGSGTKNLQADDDKGKGRGEGETGIPKKVEKGCVAVAEVINNLISNIPNAVIKKLTIDVFGFSRGAAAARHFIYVINQKVYQGGRSRKVITKFGKLGKELIAKSIEEPLTMEVRYAGIYDTVASYGLEHVWDTSQLDLDAISKAKHTLHLVAQDEHRENFVLTNINSSIAQGRGKEIYIPGVHSDIGGGYTNDYEETRLYIKNGGPEYLANDMMEKLIKYSWYKKNEIFKNNAHMLYIDRIVKSNKYSFISLFLMIEYGSSEKNGFIVSQLTDKYSMNESVSVKLSDNSIYTTKLTVIKDRIENYIKGKDVRMSFNNYKDQNMLRAIRSNYVHTSAHYNDKIIGGNYAPHKPRDSYWTREREINDG